MPDRSIFSSSLGMSFFWRHFFPGGGREGTHQHSSKSILEIRGWLSWEFICGQAGGGWKCFWSSAITPQVPDAGAVRVPGARRLRGALRRGAVWRWGWAPGMPFDPQTQTQTPAHARPTAHTGEPTPAPTRLNITTRPSAYPPTPARTHAPEWGWRGGEDVRGPTNQLDQERPPSPPHSGCVWPCFHPPIHPPFFFPPGDGVAVAVTPRAEVDEGTPSPIAPPPDPQKPASGGEG